MKRILITGANSYIGMSFESYMKNYEDCEIETIDMIDGTWRGYDFSKYDAVFHVAGIAHIKETPENAQLYHQVNCNLAFEVAQKAKDMGVGQFVFLSSMSVYGKDYGDIDINTVPEPITNYGISKLMAEGKISSLKHENFKVVIVRPPMIYGKGCKGNYQTLKKLALKLPVFPYVNNQRSMLYIDNLCEFIRLIINNEEQGVFWPQNKEYSNTSDLVKIIAKKHGKKILLIRGFGWLIKLLGRVTRLADKAFGSLIYESVMSEYKEEYCVVGLEESVIRTES